MKAASLCMGIGGLDLAVEAVYGTELAWCAEYEAAPSSVIERHWPGVPNLHDLTTIDWAACEPVDVLSAGYPCQPFSHAGKRKGADDARHLWPYIAEAVRVLRPRRVVLENVAGHLTLGFGTVLGDLAEAGYDAEWCLLRASDVGAPHQRARLFVVAADTDAEHAPQRGRVGGGLDRAPRAGEGVGRERQRLRCAADEGGADAADAANLGHERPECARGRRHGSTHGGCPPADAESGGGSHLSRSRPSTRLPLGAVAGPGGGDRPGDPAEGVHLDGRPSDVVAWGIYEPAIRRWELILGRPAPRPTDDAGRLSPPFVGWMQGYEQGWEGDLSRTDALKAFGNSVCPQQGTAALDLLERAHQQAVAA